MIPRSRKSRRKCRVDFHWLSPPRMSGMSQRYVEARKVLLDNKKAYNKRKTTRKRRKASWKMFVNAEIEHREPRPRTEACFRSAALQPSRDGADGKPFSSHARAKALVIRISWSLKNPRLAYARDVTRRKRAGKRTRLCLCADEIDCRALFWTTHDTFPLFRRFEARIVLLWRCNCFSRKSLALNLLRHRIGSSSLPPLLHPAVLYGKRHSRWLAEPFRE